MCAIVPSTTDVGLDLILTRTVLASAVAPASFAGVGYSQPSTSYSPSDIKPLLKGKWKQRQDNAEKSEILTSSLFKNALSKAEKNRKPTTARLAKGGGGGKPPNTEEKRSASADLSLAWYREACVMIEFIEFGF